MQQCPLIEDGALRDRLHSTTTADGCALSHSASRFWPIVLFILLGGPLVLLGVLLLWESTYVGFFAPREVLRLYHFGSECMAWQYENRHIYFVTGLAKGALILLLPVVVAWWLRRRTLIETRK